MRLSALAAVLVVLPLIGGCGGDEGGDDKGPAKDGGQQKSESIGFDTAIREAQSVKASDFPAARGKTLQQVADSFASVQTGLATSEYTPGDNRLAFGMIDQANKFIYGRSAVYLARGPGRKAIGPFAAPADPLLVEPPFRSKGAALATDEIAAIYEARVKLPKAGKWYVLAATKNGGKFYGAATQITVKRATSIPEVGETPPKIATETRASAGGDIKLIDTRDPPDDMHDIAFQDVVGKKPVVLLFATPQLCQTRVCGPVVDIEAQMKNTYGDRAAFIHQEVYVDNDLKKGLRPPLVVFKLRTEPWLFTFDKQGRVAARVEGSFGNGAFRRAIEAAL